MSHSEPGRSTGIRPMLGSTFGRLKNWAGRAPSAVALPTLPAVKSSVPLGLAAALTLSMTPGMRALPSHPAPDTFKNVEKSLQIVVNPRQISAGEAVAKNDSQAAMAPGDWVTPEALNAVLVPMNDGPRFMMHGDDRTQAAWSSVFATAAGLSISDFAVSDGVMAQLVA